MEESSPLTLPIGHWKTKRRQTHVGKLLLRRSYLVSRREERRATKIQKVGDTSSVERTVERWKDRGIRKRYVPRSRNVMTSSLVTMRKKGFKKTRASRPARHIAICPTLQNGELYRVELAISHTPKTFHCIHRADGEADDGSEMGNNSSDGRTLQSTLGKADSLS